MASSLSTNPPPGPQTADFSHIWPFLEDGVQKLMDSPERVSATEYVNLSATVYNLAMRSRACALDLQKNLTETFIKRVQLTANEAEKLVDLDLLRYYVKEFQGYKTGLERVNSVFAWHNRRWAKKIEEGPLDVILPVSSLGLTQWKEQFALVIQRDGKKITCAILQLITKERSGEEIEEDVVKDAIDSFIALDIDHHNPGSFYQEEFAAPFLQTTADYYKKELDQVFESENFISDYLNKVEEHFLEEERRAKRYLPLKTHNQVIRTLLISDHCQVLARVLLQVGDNEKLRRMYTLLSRIKPDGLGPLKMSFELHVSLTNSGVELAAPADNGDTSVNTSVQGLPVQLSLSDIQQKHREFVNACFQGDLDFVAILGNDAGGSNDAVSNENDAGGSNEFSPPAMPKKKKKKK